MKIVAIVVASILVICVSITFGYAFGEFHAAQMEMRQNGFIATSKLQNDDKPDWFAHHQIKFGFEACIRLSREYNSLLGEIFLSRDATTNKEQCWPIIEYISLHPSLDWSYQTREAQPKYLPIQYIPFYAYQNILGLTENNVRRQYAIALTNIKEPEWVKMLNAQK